LNDLLNRELVRLNYKFSSPNFSQFNNEVNESAYVEEESNGKINEMAVVHHFSDEDEQQTISNQKLAVKSALLHQNNNNNSRFTSATTRADEMEDDGKFRNRNEDIDQIDPKKILLLSNIEPIAWRKEYEKVSKQLDEFDEQMQQKPETLTKQFEKDDFMHNLNDLTMFSSVIFLVFYLI